jgi:hypothetical protein
MVSNKYSVKKALCNDYEEKEECNKTNNCKFSNGKCTPKTMFDNKLMLIAVGLMVVYYLWQRRQNNLYSYDIPKTFD